MRQAERAVPILGTIYMYIFIGLGYLFIVGIVLVIVEVAHWQTMQILYRESSARSDDGMWRRWGASMVRHASHGIADNMGNWQRDQEAAEVQEERFALLEDALERQQQAMERQHEQLRRVEEALNILLTQHVAPSDAPAGHGRLLGGNYRSRGSTSGTTALDQPGGCVVA